MRRLEVRESALVRSRDVKASRAVGQSRGKHPSKLCLGVPQQRLGRKPSDGMQHSMPFEVAGAHLDGKAAVSPSADQLQT